MNQRTLWIGVVIAGLLVAVALGLLMRGRTLPDPPPSVEDVPPLGSAAEVPAPREPAPRAEREPPAAPQQVADHQVTASGLKFHDFVVGDGPSPTSGQTVVVDYTGWLQDGTRFDSSLDRSRPLEFPIDEGEVIAGWDEGIASMKVGGRRQLVVPPEIAYGPAGRPPRIPPDATLVFEIELVGVK